MIKFVRYLKQIIIKYLLKLEIFPEIENAYLIMIILMKSIIAIIITIAFYVLINYIENK